MLLFVNMAFSSYLYLLITNLNSGMEENCLVPFDENIQRTSPDLKTISCLTFYV